MPDMRSMKSLALSGLPSGPQKVDAAMLMMRPFASSISTISRWACGVSSPGEGPSAFGFDARSGTGGSMITSAGSPSQSGPTNFMWAFTKSQTVKNTCPRKHASHAR